MTKPGRNDPCYCGSGKKYKKCHLAADEHDTTGQRPLPASQPPPASSLVDQWRGSSAKRLGRQDHRTKLSRLRSEIRPVLEYAGRQAEIGAAAAELEEHRSEFDELMEDERSYLALVETLFAEECFADLRFTESDVQCAFEHVGYPVLSAPAAQTVQLLRAAILHAADNERRLRLAMNLLLRLPEFVAARRYREAWVIQCSALETSEMTDESNPFLFLMFSHGYDAWVAGKRGKDESLLRKIGVDVDRLRAMDPDELESWFQSHGPDAATVEAFFRKNPDAREEAIANAQASERNSVELLNREDASVLHVPKEEAHPWVIKFYERANEQGFLNGAPEGLATAENARKMFDEVLLPVVREMAASIFVPDRLRRLVLDLTKYRADRFTAGETSAAMQAMGAITYLNREDSPGENAFLLNLCWASLKSAMDAMSAENIDA